MDDLPVEDGAADSDAPSTLDRPAAEAEQEAAADTAAAAKALTSEDIEPDEQEQRSHRKRGPARTKQQGGKKRQRDWTEQELEADVAFAVGLNAYGLEDAEQGIVDDAEEEMYFQASPWATEDLLTAASLPGDAHKPRMTTQQPPLLSCTRMYACLLRISPVIIARMASAPRQLHLMLQQQLSGSILTPAMTGSGLYTPGASPGAEPHPHPLALRCLPLPDRGRGGSQDRVQIQAPGATGLALPVPPWLDQLWRGPGHHVLPTASTERVCGGGGCWVGRWEADADLVASWTGVQYGFCALQGHVLCVWQSCTLKAVMSCGCCLAAQVRTTGGKAGADSAQCRPTIPAGLSAARQLRNHGYSVVVLEAAARGGGRVHGIRLEVSKPLGYAVHPV